MAGTFDLTLLENTDVVDRSTRASTFQADYRFGSRADVGGNYTLSKASGSFDGETLTSGPVTTDLLSYPEFVEARWNSPEGDLSVDQRHRARLWGTYRIPIGDAFGGIDLGVVQTLESGVPYGAVGAINTIPYAPAGLYLNPSGNRADGFWDYYFTGRDAFRTEANYRTDLALNYAYRLPGLSRVQLFFHGEVLNVFNVCQLCGCGGTVFSNGGATSLSRGSTRACSRRPTRRRCGRSIRSRRRRSKACTGRSGRHFGRQVSQFSWTTPRMFRFSLGVRF